MPSSSAAPSKPPSSVAPRNVPCVLVVRDGWGRNPHAEHDSFNGVKLAKTPVADEIERSWPTTLIRTSGEDVGLPTGPDGPTMGNSEVGHQNIGAGRIVDQELMRITRAIRDASFFENPVLAKAFDRANGGARVHLLGLVSDGQVHSDLEHLHALLEFARRRGVPGERLFVHAITDGRDTAPNAGREFVRTVERWLAGDLGGGAESSTTRGGEPRRNATRRGLARVGRIATVMGRYWAMDRDHRWDRVERAWVALVGRGGAEAPSADAAIERAYANPEEPSRSGDEFVPPVRIAGVDGEIRDGDSVIFFNFRGDRPRELTKAFVLDDAAWKAVRGGGFARDPRPRNLLFATMADYEQGLPVEVVFARPPKMKNILGAWISHLGLRQFRCAETEKFPHVTFFFNDYREEPFPGESRVIVPSPRDVSTYDQKPEMSAAGVCDAVLARLAAEDCEQLIVVNFANPDMVGHTGVLKAVIRAVEVVDACVGRILKATLARGGSLIVTADHGNAEQMIDPGTGGPHTAHTNYTVPLSVIGAAFQGVALRDDGRLADIAPTMLAMMGLPKPAEMTGRSLLERTT
ncbi:MAG: 2,3-bisphosphoglycerate-independent phosphoglycerate mutase [Phycisphaerae bacterium]|nr:2,3-bisphosphoglycerate-independent phosphoglycerate mutase [Phycisphaerae bacterium]